MFIKLLGFNDYLTKLAIPDVHYFECKTNSAKFGSLIIFENNYQVQYILRYISLGGLVTELGT